ncbi:MAG TPA: ABC transporter permease [Candidatus Limnocylindrales bacterium]|nr:ABC transporter permease [Candidatus Limnocylindrales bacterium]
MQGYIARRLLGVLPMVFLVSLVLFFALRLVPGGPLAVYTRGNVNPATIEVLREKLGLNRPLVEQYLAWLGPALQGDLGYSFRTNRPVTDEILARVPATLVLVGTTFLIVVVVAVVLGTYSARHQHSRSDIGLTTISFVGAAMPVFWLGMLLILLNASIRNPASGRPFLPIGGISTPGQPFSIPDLIAHMILPVICLGVGWVSWYSRYVRSSMLDVIHLDYIRTARAKGLRERAVVYKHALKNAALPLITLVALDLPYLFAGALFVEIIFAWPGLGNFFYFSTVNRDYAVMMGIVVFIAVFVIIGNLIADVAYSYLDPRVRYGKR